MSDSPDQKIRHRNAVARAHSQAARGQTTTLMVKETPAYSGRAREVFPIALVNVLLTFLTVGIYRFWAKTRIRRYFMSRVAFLGDPFEYSGTGMELFIGFLIVMALLVPFFFAAGFLQGFYMQPGADTLSSAIFETAYLAALYFLYNAAVYRAQRYRLSRISWRGIRGGQEGSAILYALQAIGLGFLTLVTAGLMYPVMRRVLVGYRIRHASFGAERLRFSASTIKLVGAWLVPWLLGLALLGTLAYAAESTAEATDPERFGSEIEQAWVQHWKIVLPAAILLPFAFVWYRTVETRQWINGMRFDQLAFASRLNLLHILLPYLCYLVLLVILIGTGLLGLALVAKSFGFWTSPAIPKDLAIFIPIAAVAVLWLAGSLLQPMIVQNWILKNVCRSLTIQGRFSPDTLFQNQLDIPRSGEGLADAFDVDAF